MTESRYKRGGFEPRFIIERTDGKPIDPSRRYFVLDFSGADPHAVTALIQYANLVAQENSQLAKDLTDALLDPKNAPPQHRYA